jgi:hypothetical protein
MTIAEAAPSEKPVAPSPLVRVEVEVPEAAVPALLAHAAALRGEPWALAKDLKEMLELAPGDDDFWDDVANSRDKRPARDIEL